MKEIKNLFIQGGLCMASLSLIISIALSYIGSYAMFYVYNVIVPYFTGETVRYTFYMPWYAIVTSIVISVACGYFSTYIPYLSYAKKRKATQTITLDDEFGDE
jgi:ABC-type antimicrobial peptide transport system permease subunit